MPHQHSLVNIWSKYDWGTMKLEKG